jgi:hypothetical protein
LFYKSLLDVIVAKGGGCAQKNLLRDLGYHSLMIPDMKTLLTPLHYCYEVKDLQMQSAHILLRDLMKSEVSTEYNQVLITSLLSNILDRKDISPELYDFFKTNEANGEEHH